MSCLHLLWPSAIPQPGAIEEKSFQLMEWHAEMPVSQCYVPLIVDTWEDWPMLLLTPLANALLFLQLNPHLTSCRGEALCRSLPISCFICWWCYITYHSPLRFTIYRNAFGNLHVNYIVKLAIAQKIMDLYLHVLVSFWVMWHDSCNNSKYSCHTLGVGNELHLCDRIGISNVCWRCCAIQSLYRFSQIIV